MNKECKAKPISICAVKPIPLLPFMAIMNGITPKILLLLTCILVSINSFAQTNKREGVTYRGLNYGISTFNKTNIEVGYGFVTDKYFDNENKYVLIAADLSSEFHFRDKFIFGPKISNKYAFPINSLGFKYLGLIIGADYIAYNDLRTINNVIRPSIGIHYFVDVFELSYGYNIRIDNNNALPINTHVIQFRFKPYIFIKALGKIFG